MNTINRTPLLIAGTALIFTGMFYKTGIALNLVLFNAMIILTHLYLGHFKSRGIVFRIVLTGTILTAFAVLLKHTKMSVIMNMVSLFLLSGILCYPEVKSLVNSVKLSFNNIWSSQLTFFKSINRPENRIFRISVLFRWIRIFILPLLIIIIFILLYKASNPLFNKHFSFIFNSIREKIAAILSFSMFFTFVLGLIISTFLLINIPHQRTRDLDKSSQDKLQRTRRNTGRFKINALRTELKAGIFLLLILNLLILAENIIDIYWVWFNFQWTGEYLKQFVHEGTYLLILSILISIGITLYFFRGNLNFYKKNNLIKLLSYIWLVQNVILAISVGFRNYRYIEVFALAFKRIAVFFFLALVLFGIISVIYKITRRLTSTFLFKVNSVSFYAALVLFSLFNWDVIISRYNFDHYQESFVHLDFMSKLSDYALPYTIKTLDELHTIDGIQKKLFHFEEKFMLPFDYYTNMQTRKSEFIKKWESKKMLEWNLAGQMTYNKLIAEENDKK